MYSIRRKPLLHTTNKHTENKMSNINDVVANENPRDVILFIVRNKSISYPMVDMLYSGNSWVNIGNNLELLSLFIT